MSSLQAYTGPLDSKVSLGSLTWIFPYPGFAYESRTPAISLTLEAHCTSMPEGKSPEVRLQPACQKERKKQSFSGLSDIASDKSSVSTHMRIVLSKLLRAVMEPYRKLVVVAEFVVVLVTII